MIPDVLRTRWASLPPSSLPGARARQGTVPADEARRGVIRTQGEAESK